MAFVVELPSIQRKRVPVTMRAEDVLLLLSDRKSEVCRQRVSLQQQALVDDQSLVQCVISSSLKPSQPISFDSSASGENVSFSIDNDAKDRVRTAVDIVDLIGGYIQLRRQGPNFVGLCPFHEDRRPSFNVNPNRQTWKCWVCDLGGDVFSFLMEKERISFPEALQMLADRAGITLEKSKLSSQGTAGSHYKKSLYDAMAWACHEYHQHLLHEPSSEVARSYLRDRGLTDKSLATFQLGFAPENWNWLLDRGVGRGLKAETLEAIGLAAKSERGSRYDRFRGRVLFPIHDPQGRPIAIGGRILPGAPDNQAKYVNCNETRLYHKSSQLYGLHLAKDSIQQSRTAIVMEGYTDVIMANQHGIANAVAVCGTALGEGHIRLLKRYCDTVVLLLDGDEAGQKRTNEILELFVVAQLDLRVATLPDELDPCDFLIERGPKAMQAIIEKSVDALEHKLGQVCNGFDPLNDTHRANLALEQMLDLLAKAPRSALIANEAARLRQEQILVRLARRFGLENADLRARLESLRRRTESRRQPSIPIGRDQQSSSTAENSTSTTDKKPNPSKSTAPDSSMAKSYRFSDLEAVDKELFEILVLHAELVPLALERFPTAALASNTAQTLWKVYMDLELQGYSLEFQSVLAAVEDNSLKNILVTLADQASEKATMVKLDADIRLQSLCDRLMQHEQNLHDQRRLMQLESKALSEDEELMLLQKMIQDARSKQGLVVQQE